ncbi:M15 family metallopeptidase [Nannocystis pusilla]|uniref:M15 family metallopeptidase n=1 Tax=Nannocystis pusilla TaxID=889268 RepID=UPI003BF30030
MPRATLALVRALAAGWRPAVCLLVVACAGPPPTAPSHVLRDSSAPVPAATGRTAAGPGASAVPADSSVPGQAPAGSDHPDETSPVPEDSPSRSADLSRPGRASLAPDSPHVPEDSPAPGRSPPAHDPEHGRPAPPVPKAISPVGPPPPGLVDLRAELPGACFDVRYATADNFTGAVLPGYAAAGAWLRPRPAGALAKVQAAVSAEGLTLLVYDAYRPARASLAMVEWAERSGRRRLVDDGYIARRSGHNRGDTVDLTLARPGTCEPLDMGTAWDHFGPESHYARAGGDALSHRRQLRRVMQAQGFTPYDKEWWHFTFRDPDAAALDVSYQPAP